VCDNGGRLNVDILQKIDAYIIVHVL